MKAKKMKNKLQIKEKNFLKTKALKIISILEKNYPDAGCSLNYSNPLELFISAILSAQTSDHQVNIVTKRLFTKFNTIEDFINISQKELEKEIHSIGLYRNKAKNIKACCKKIYEEYGGVVPSKMEELLSLPGIGRKIANVILSTWFKKDEGIVVDTHVLRLSQRIGLSNQKYATNVEKDLMDIIPKDKWYIFSHLLIKHGRNICKARNPLCIECNISSLCDFYQKISENFSKKIYLKLK